MEGNENDLPEGLENHDDDAAIAAALAEAGFKTTGVETLPQATTATSKSEQQGATTGTEGKTTTDATGTEGTQATGTTEGNPATQQQEADASKTQANPHKVLRAVRRNEQRLLSENERLKQELEELRKQQGTQAASKDGDELSVEELAELERDFPSVAKALKRVRQAEAAKPATQASQATQTEQSEFTPPHLPEEVQDAVDAVPLLQAWQYDPDQSRFQRAIQVDEFLRTSPAWKDKPMAERFMEVTRLVSAELGAPATASTTTPPAKTAAQIAAELEAQARTVAPSTLSDFGGGAGGRGQPEPTLQQMSRMSQDELFMHLQTAGD